MFTIIAIITHRAKQGNSAFIPLNSLAKSGVFNGWLVASSRPHEAWKHRLIIPHRVLCSTPRILTCTETIVRTAYAIAPVGTCGRCTETTCHKTQDRRLAHTEIFAAFKLMPSHSQLWTVVQATL